MSFPDDAMGFDVDTGLISFRLEYSGLLGK